MCVAAFLWLCGTGGNLVSLDGQRRGSRKGLTELRCDTLNVHITTWMDLESRVKRDIATTQ